MADNPPSQSTDHVPARRSTILWAVLFTAIAAGRIVATYSVTSQGFDEPCHVAAGIELLDKGTYTLDPVHPPLFRYAVAVPLYLAGERYPTSGPAATSTDYNVVGDSILYDSGHYRRNLMLARLAVLPFLLFAVVVVFLWARHEFGDYAAVMAVALFTTLPTVLAFSSLAYTDMTAASTQMAALFAFVLWLEKRSARSSIVLGVALGFALLAKLTALIFLPAAGLGIWITKWAVTRKSVAEQKPQLGSTIRQATMAALIAITLLWGGYKFAIGRVREGMQLSAASMPSFQNFPTSLRGLARNLVISDPLIPAPALFRGLAEASVLNHAPPDSYLFGKIKRGGWWYFFGVGVATKSPLPFLFLTLVGFVALWPLARRRWSAAAPGVAALAVLVATMGVKYNVGVRHVMVVFPLLAVVAGCGCAQLWRARKNWHFAPGILLLALLTWQGISTLRSRHDYIAYFNELGGQDPSRILVLGCDLDCGQDIFRLSDSLRARKISQLSLAVWSSADMSQMGLPSFTVPPPYTPVHGWVAVSLRSLRYGSVLHHAYPHDAYAWLDRYQPVEKIGSTIRLYYIP